MAKRHRAPTTQLPAQLPDRPKRPQPHGGALNTGNPGHVGGSGRLPSVVRQACREAFDKRIPTLEAIADGAVMKKVSLPLAAILRYATCPRCAGEFKAIDPAAVGAMLVTIEGLESAAPGERIKSIAELAKWGMGASISTEDVRDRLAAQWRVIRAALPAKDAERLVTQIAAVWR